MFLRGVCVALLALLACVPARAVELMPPKKTLFVFFGQFNKGTFPGWTLVPYAASVESNFLVGGAYDVQFVDWGLGFTSGIEVGADVRFGDRAAAELWFGGRLRHIGIPIGPARFSPGLALGFSGVTDTIGIERERELQAGGNARFLYYAGPELAVRFAGMPDVEFVFRAHHRSGLFGDLGKMHEASNAYVFGVRFPFELR